MSCALTYNIFLKKEHLTFDFPKMLDEIINLLES